MLKLTNKSKIKPRRPTDEPLPETIEPVAPTRPPLEIPMNPDRAARLGLPSEPLRAINPMLNAPVKPVAPIIPITPPVAVVPPVENTIKAQNPLLFNANPPTGVDAEMIMKQGQSPPVFVPPTPVVAVHPALSQNPPDAAIAAPPFVPAAGDTAADSSKLTALRPSQQTAAKINELRNRKYDDKWGILDTLKGAGLGFLKGFATTGRLSGGIGGAGVGAVQGTIDPNTDEKFSTQNEIAKLTAVQGQQQEQEQFDLSEDRAQIAAENIRHDNSRQDAQDAAKAVTDERNSLLRQVRMMKRYKQGENPDFDAKLGAANIEQPDFEPEKRLKPRFYDSSGRMMTFDENNATVPVLVNGKEVVDETRATVYVNGYAVKGRDALSATTAAGTANTRFSNDDDQDKIKYENDVREVNAFNSGIDAEIQSKREIAKNLELANETLQSQRAQLNSNPLLNSEQIKQLDQQINSNTNQWRTANGEITALGGKKKPLPITPKPRSRVETPTVSSGTPRFTVDEIRTGGKSRGWSEAQIQAKINEAKNGGWLNQ